MASKVPVDVETVVRCPYHDYGQLTLHVERENTKEGMTVWRVVVYCSFSERESHPLYRVVTEVVDLKW